jgi:hypothetical protein
MDFKKISEKKIDAYLSKLDDAYYNQQPLISDDEYDRLIDIYEQRFGKREKIGAPPTIDLERIKLPFFLGSLDKIKINFDENKTKKAEKSINIIHQ